MNVINALLSLETSHAVVDRSMSPMFSNFGLCFDAQSAAGKLVLHYNRFTRTLWEPFIDFSGAGEVRPTFASTRIINENTDCEIVFYDTDAFIVCGRTAAAARLFCVPDAALGEIWTAYRDEKTLILQGYSENGDARDPDRYAPVACGVRVLRGTLSAGAGETLILPEEDGGVLFAVVCRVLDFEIDEIKDRLAAAPGTAEVAKEKMRAWAENAAGGIDFLPEDDRTRSAVLTAVSGLLMNLTAAPGNLAGYLSAFPSRGGYPTHFMWDSAFQNLAYELMSGRVAADTLLLLARCARPDGKIPQFNCSTWERPHETQPALLGWAAKRYAERVGIENLAPGFVETIYDALSRNNKWWLTGRATKYGLIYCPHGLETGQDDSPRFDDGPVIAVDMNSYLLSQMRAAAYFASLAGDAEGEAYWNAEAERFGALMIKHLYDPEKNLFFDADLNTGRPLSLVTLSSLIPLWAGVPLPEEKIRAMIEDYLLNEKYFFGAVPFPSVAYCEEKYEHAHWWRGPTWMPVAWLMLEILEKYGYQTERETAANRLFDIMKKDGELHELFDSQTGEGLGCAEQGWTAAIFLRLAAEKE
ncbi:MAG: hypothetical protein IJK23_07920 [Clostridia bacterium]|nr:hypothetical protein [Clostridia bacterium]